MWQSDSDVSQHTWWLGREPIIPQFSDLCISKWLVYVFPFLFYVWSCKYSCPLVNYALVLERFVLLDIPLVTSLVPPYVLLPLAPSASTPPPSLCPIGCIPYPRLSIPQHKLPGPSDIFSSSSLVPSCETYTRSPLCPLPPPACLTTSPGVAPSGEELTLYPFCVWSCWNQRVQPDLWASLFSGLVCPHSLCSQERLVKQEPRHPAVTYPGGPWPVVHGVRAETNTGVCMTSSQPTYNNSREGHSRVSFWSGKRVWVGEKKRRRCLFLYFNLCLPKISFNDTHPSVWLQN